MTTLIVDTLADVVAGDGKLSLREAVAQANATPTADTIRFSKGLEGGTLVLTSGQLTLTRDTTLDGDWDNNGTEVTISGNDATRILQITGSATAVNQRDLALAHGDADYGGGIYAASGTRVAIDDSGCSTTMPAWQEVPSPPAATSP